YFHLQNVVLRGEFVENGRRVSLRAGDSEMQVMLTDVSTVSGPVEVRAQLYDVGRLTASDPRLGRYENKPDQDHWPQPGEELLLNITSVATAGRCRSPASSAAATCLATSRRLQRRTSTTSCCATPRGRCG